VAYLKPKIERWKQETYDIARELWIANQILAKPGGDGRPPKKVVSNDTTYSFEQYCKDIGISKPTAYRWTRNVLVNLLN